MLTYQEVEPRVRRGVELLDRVAPNWWQQIETNELAMEEACNCILGQLYGLYSHGVALVFKAGSPTHQEHQALEHGFVSPDDDYPLIEQTWRSWITSRRQAAAKPDFNPEEFKR